MIMLKSLCNHYWTTLVEQPEKEELEYRVIALNKSGEGQASNAVMFVVYIGSLQDYIVEL